MRFKDIEKVAKKVVDISKKNCPIAIIQYGSSLREEEFIPGISQLDFIILNASVGLHIPNVPETIIRYINPINFREYLHEGNPHIWNAFNNGKILYDKYDFLKMTSECIDKEFKIKEDTKKIFSYTASAYLSSAINRYFSKDKEMNSKINIFRNNYRLIKEVCRWKILKEKGKLVDGLINIVDEMKKIDPELSEQILAHKTFLMGNEIIKDIRESEAYISDKNEVGLSIIGAEEVYLLYMLETKINLKFNQLVKLYKENKTPLEKTLAVNIDGIRKEYAVLGMQNNIGTLLRIENIDRPKEEIKLKMRDYKTKETIDEVCNKLRIFN